MGALLDLLKIFSFLAISFNFFILPLAVLPTLFVLNFNMCKYQINSRPSSISDKQKKY